MRSEENPALLQTGVVLGYLSAYFLFTTILFFALSFVGKLPAQWSYLHVMGITAAIAIVGALCERMLR